MDKFRIAPPALVPVQTFVTDRLQLGGLLEQLLAYTGAARLTVSTFSTAEEFLRKLFRLKEKHLVISAEVYLDHKAAEKTARIHPMLRTVYDHVHFVQNHSKTLVIEGERLTVAVLTSQNQTRGNRLENYTIIASQEVADELKRTFQQLKTFDLW